MNHSSSRRQAGELALHFNKSEDEIDLAESLPLSAAELGSLSWLPKEASRSLCERFPHFMLCRVQREDRDEPKVATDALCCLLMLHGLLRVGAVDLVTWLQQVRRREHVLAP